MKLELDLHVIATICITVFVLFFVQVVSKESLTKIEADHQLSLAKISIEQASLITQQKGKKR